MKQGIFYAVGVGPGEAELITVKAVRILKESPVIAAPVTKKKNMAALDIAGQCVDMSEKEILPLEFTMTKDREILAANYKKQAEKITAYLKKGRDVAMVNIGDVSIYATCSYIAAFIRQAGYEAVMVPGVPSFCAVAAKLGVSLTKPDAPLHIIPASYGIGNALDLEGSKVLMKSGRGYQDVKEELKEKELLGNAMMVESCGLPEEKVYPDMADAPKEAGYFTTILVRAD